MLHAADGRPAPFARPWCWSRRAIPIELQDRKYGVRVAIIRRRRTAAQRGLRAGGHAPQMPAEALRVRFPTQVKIGPVERIRDLVNLQLPGIGAARRCRWRRARSPTTPASTTSSSTAAANCGSSSSARAAWRCTSPANFPDWTMEFWAIRT
ncbi:MAG: type VI secretion system baseplate subunit TssK [Chromatiales bacterium]|nr:type VI secretion system baseplate subunit TssK [Chromatiales bacterium]